MGIRLYDGAPQDFDAIRDMHLEAYPDETPDRALSTASKNPTWLLDDGKVIASCLISEISNSAPYVWSVATRSTHRGRGHASLLMNEFEKHYREEGYARAWLHTKADNPAQKLYFDLGYRVASFEPNCYGVHQHGLIMRKRFV